MLSQCEASSTVGSTLGYQTCQDILQTKAAIAASSRAFRDRGRRVPIFCQVTMETTGTMLVGTDISAALTAIEPFSEVSVFGLNCATGPQEMSEHVAYLGKYSPRLVSVVPNAGLPQLVDGKTHYPLTPKELASWLVRFIEEDGVGMVGGCCGTTPEHIREVAKAVGNGRRRAEPSIHRSADLSPPCRSSGMPPT
jgi:5-methyltetrahydrofolate--homocysteine methyltransferase